MTTRVVILVLVSGFAAAVAAAGSTAGEVKTNGLIAFQRGVGLSPAAQIWTIAASGGSERRLISSELNGVVRPQWSPDGRRIAFLSDDRPGQLAFVAAANGAKQKPLLPASAQEVHGVSWSPNGKKIAFSGTVGQTTGLFS